LAPAVGQFEEDRVEDVFVDSVVIPDGVEIAGFVFGGDEAAVQPDSCASGLGQERQRLGETVELDSAGLVPPESFEYLGPRRAMLACGQVARVRFERRY
jgi:hypothetical protein